MESITLKNGLNILLREISNQSLDELPKDKTYCCVLFIKKNIPDKEKEIFIEKIISTGCVHIFLWGQDIDKWRDAIDCAPNNPNNNGVPVEADPESYHHDPVKVIDKVINYKNLLRKPDYYLFLFVGKHEGLENSISEILKKKSQAA